MHKEPSTPSVQTPTSVHHGSVAGTNAVARIHTKSEINSDQIQAALQSIFVQAATDADFRALCLDDPAVAVKSVGLVFPSDAKIKFVEQKVGEPSDELAFVLPPFGADPDALQDDQLDGIAGGASKSNTHEMREYLKKAYPGVDERGLEGMLVDLNTTIIHNLR